MNTNAADSPRENAQSPRSLSRGNHSSPKSVSLTSPWTQIVRRGNGGSDSVVENVSSASKTAAVVGQEHIGASGSVTDYSHVKASSSAFVSAPNESIVVEGADNVNGGKKPVWIAPSNGEVRSLDICENSWPRLSESAKTSSKSYSDPPKFLSGGPSSVSQGIEIVTTHKQATSSKSSSSSQTHVLPTRQTSMNSRGGNASGNNGVLAPPPVPAVPGLAVETASSNNRPNTQTRVESGSHSYGGYDHPHPRNSMRRGNGGHYPRGDGSYNPNHGGRRDQNHRGSRDLNPQRREGHMQPSSGPIGYMRPIAPQLPYNAAPFFGPPSARPFVTPMGFHEPPPMYFLPGPLPESIRGVSFVPSMAPHGMYYHEPDSQHAQILKQINYYFSEANLAKDEYLRRHMDEQCWVSVELIMGFKKIKELTDNKQLILATMQTSTEVEVQGEKLRKRYGWQKYPNPASTRYVTNPAQDINTVTNQARNLFIGTSSSAHAESSSSASNSG